jgi:tartrate-resistant acid phosphatase type 5
MRRPITRRDFAVSGSSAFLTPLLARSAPVRADASGVRFLVLGDWGRANSQDQLRVAEAMSRIARIDRPRFVISTGDNFYANGVANDADQLWAEVFEKVYTDETLQCPWYAVLGNHDYRGNEDAEIAYGARSPRWTMPARYYSRVESVGAGETAEFFFLDTTPLASHRPRLWTKWLQNADPGQQLEWLERSLRRSSARWKIVVGHHPVVSAGPHLAEAELVASIKPVMERYGVQAYFSGHEHNLQHHVESGVNYFVCGAGHQVRPTSQPCNDSFCASSLGFIRAALTPAALNVDFLSEETQVLHTATIPPR